MVIFPICFEYLEFLDSFTKITPTFTAQFYSKFPNEKKARRSEYEMNFGNTEKHTGEKQCSYLS